MANALSESSSKHICPCSTKLNWTPYLCILRRTLIVVNFHSVMGLRAFWTNYKVLIVMGTGLGLIHWGCCCACCQRQVNRTESVSMKPRSWLRRNWMWAAGGAFVTIHVVTWVMQRTMKSAARSEAALKQKPAQERVD
ncbi:hypothetical protein Q5P01_025760 [Channa striata]|uniref:Uncharacterized protein n=1 Tax=Channa striata TaxID=64152 RepID=A0AA88J2F3_CHASR|nr:hypothetical protein Q5P01_025760 [Channa striata]